MKEQIIKAIVACLTDDELQHICLIGDMSPLVYEDVYDVHNQDEVVDRDKAVKCLMELL